MPKNLVLGGLALLLLATAVYALPEPGDPRGLTLYLGVWTFIVAALALIVWGVTWTTRARWIVAVVVLVEADLFWSRAEFAEFIVVAALLAPAAWMVYLQGRRPVFEYIHVTRYPLLILLVFFSLGPLCLWGAPAFLGNLLELRTRSLLFVTALALIVAKALVLIVDLFVRWGDVRTDKPWKAAALFTGRLVRTAGSDVFALPLILILLLRADTSSRWVALTAIAAGALIGHSIIYLAMLLSAYLGPQKVEPGGPIGSVLPVDPLAEARRKQVPWSQDLHKRVEQSIQEKGGSLQRALLTKQGKLLPGIVTVAAFVPGTLLVYAIAYVPLRPGHLLGAGSPYEVPALAYLLGLILLLALAFSAVSFIVDPYRVPAAAVLLALPLLFFFLNDVDYYYELPPVPAQAVPASAAPPLASPAAQGQLARVEAAEENDIRKALRARTTHWLQNRGGRRPVVIAVAASGGGITAAYWTAHVLTGLQQELGPDFSDAVHFISAVSGGSAGTAQYAHGFGPATLPDPAAVTTAAGQSSLSAVAWGMTYPDFWRTWGAPPFNVWRDRGWALEEMWSRTVPRDETLAKWRGETLAGWRPAVAFNATVAETGERLVFSSLLLNTIPPACLLDGGSERADCDAVLDARTVWTWYPHNTIPVVRAARLSAAFPFVSPIAKPRLAAASAKVDYHVADGGYYDNFGIVTLIEWMRKVVLRWPEIGKPLTAEPPLLLIVEVRESDYRGGNARQPHRRAGWTYAFTGPLNTMLEVRRSSQATRNDLDLQLFSDWAQSKGGWDVRRAIFSLPADAPMSWHLSDGQKGFISGQWTLCHQVPSSSIGQAYATVAEALGKTITQPLVSGDECTIGVPARRGPTTPATSPATPPSGPLSSPGAPAGSTPAGRLPPARRERR
jgi:hypothetical protein